MKRKKPVIFTFLLPLFLLLILSYPNAAELKTSGDILQFASPGPSPQDLAWDGTYLWNADDSTDMIYMLNPVNGAVMLQFPSPASQPRGLTWDGSSLWCSDDSTKMIYQLNPLNGKVLVMIDAPVLDYNGEPSPLGGLAWDGTYLWSGFSAGFSSRMNQIDPGGGPVVQFYFTRGEPDALAADGNYIWNASDNDGLRSGLIYQYALPGGSSVTDLETPGSYPTGLAYDGQDLWCSDNETDTIYELTIRKEKNK